MALSFGSDLRAVISEVARKHGYEHLKEEQLSAIEKFVSGHDVFVSLPTGFGKSLIYGLLPAVFDRMRGHTAPTSIALVVSPLASLMMDQKATFLPRGISAEFLGEIQYDAHALKRVREGQHSLVFLTPENLFHGMGMREMLLSETFQSKLVAFVVDEACRCRLSTQAAVSKGALHGLRSSIWLLRCAAPSFSLRYDYLRFDDVSSIT